MTPPLRIRDIVPDRLYTLDEAMAFLRCNRARTFYRWVAAGKPARVPGYSGRPVFWGGELLRVVGERVGVESETRRERTARALRAYRVATG